MALTEDLGRAPSTCLLPDKAVAAGHWWGYRTSMGTSSATASPVPCCGCSARPPAAATHR